MQVLKKIALFFLCLGLFGCNSPLTYNRIELSDQRYDIIAVSYTHLVSAVENDIKMEELPAAETASLENVVSPAEENLQTDNTSADSVKTPDVYKRQLKTLRGFSEDDLASMLDENSKITAKCGFCSETYEFTIPEIMHKLN